MAFLTSSTFIGTSITSPRNTHQPNPRRRRVPKAEPRPVQNRRQLQMVLSTRQKTLKLRELLESTDIHLMPCCYDGLSAKLIQRAGFDLTFLSGFATAGAYGYPDTGLMSYKEVEQAVARATAVVDIPLIADGDTGFGNAVNVYRTVTGFARAGASGILIEDQVNPKRCGHTKGKAVVDREEALRRVRAACDARDALADGDGGPVILARTDAARFDFEEALTRTRLFREIGADMTFLEAPQSEAQMRRYCTEVEGPKLANMLEMGDSPILPPSQLQDIGYAVAAYPLTLISAAVKAQELALQALKRGDPKEVQTFLKSFEDLRDVVGFPDYYEMEEKYK